MTALSLRENAAPFEPAALEARPHLFTVREFVRLGEQGFLPEDGQGRAELVDGRIEIMPTDGEAHVFALGVLADFFYRGVITNPALDARWTVRVKATLELGERTAREPDLMIAAPVPPTRLPHAGDVGLIVEVAVSGLVRDTEAKRRDYAAAGVPDYWVWDVGAERLVVFRAPEGGDYGEKRTLSPDDTIAPLFAPDLNLSLAELAAPRR